MPTIIMPRTPTASLWRGRLPPVGQRISHATTNATTNAALAGELDMPGFRLLPVASGTAALGLALRIARARRPDIKQPEVLLPGYACPDLLAAANWAGVKPLLIDIGADDHALDRTDLARRCTVATIGIVAVNLLGIADDLTELRRFCATRQLLLIEDDAQWLPEPWAAQTLHGDLVVLSFGRGKPVPLVGGGALLVRESSVETALPVIEPAAHQSLPLTLQIAAYNFVLEPRIYGLLSLMPFLKLGATRYHPLDHVAAMSDARMSRLAPNLNRQLLRTRERESWLRELVVPACPPGTLDLPIRGGARTHRLLRYPLLLPSREQRDALFLALHRAGLGASRMYENVLPDVSGVPSDVDCPPLPNARQFAARLLTLPVHEGVTRADAQAMAAIAMEVRERV